MNNNKRKDDIMNMLAGKLGKSAEEIENSAKQGNVDSLIGKLSPAQQEKVKALLSNPEQTRKLMENPQVQALIRKLQGNG